MLASETIWYIKWGHWRAKIWPHITSGVFFQKNIYLYYLNLHCNFECKHIKYNRSTATCKDTQTISHNHFWKRVPRYVGHPKTSTPFVSFNNLTLLVVHVMYERGPWQAAWHHKAASSPLMKRSHSPGSPGTARTSRGGVEGGHLLNQALLRHRVWWKVIRRYQPCDYQRPVQTHYLLLIL